MAGVIAPNTSPRFSPPILKPDSFSWMLCKPSGVVSCPNTCFYSVADTGYLSGKFVKDGKPALAKYHSDDVADVLEVISQQRDCRNDCTDAGNNRAECAKQCHESAAQFCGHWAYRRTQYVQPCAADVQGTLHCTQSAAADFGCRTRHLAADTEDGRTHLGLADGLPRIGQPVSNDCLSCAEEIFSLHLPCRRCQCHSALQCRKGSVPQRCRS